MIKYKITSLGKILFICTVSAFIILVVFFTTEKDKSKYQKPQKAYSEAAPTAAKVNVAAPETITPKIAVPTPTPIPAKKNEQPLTPTKKHPPSANKAETSVLFASDSSVLDEQNRKFLTQFCKDAKTKNNFVIVIESNCITATAGDTNKNKLVDNNMDLAKKRATAVKEYLTTTLGVPENHIHVISSCDKKPYIINTKGSRLLN